MKKILLLHGWNYANYKNVANNPNETPWHNRQEFIDLLQSQGFELTTPSFPGFVGYEDGDPKKEWFIDDYVNYCNELVESHRPDVLLGYSFGGAVATLWKTKFGVNSQIKLILISPALEREYTVKSNIKILNLKYIVPKNLLSFARDLYLRFVVKNPYYTKGTIFLKNSYLNIVKVKCGNQLFKIRPEQMLLVFGSNDTATPPDLLTKMFKGNKNLSKQIIVISGGGHDIANTHAEEIVEKIKNFM